MFPYATHNPAEALPKASDSMKAEGNTVSEPLVEATFNQTEFSPPSNLGPKIKDKSLPTNKWWNNLILPNKEGEIYSIYSHPYRLKVQTTRKPHGVIATYTFAHRTKGPINKNGAIEFYLHGLDIKDFVLSAAEFNHHQPQFQVADWDDNGAVGEFFNQQGKMTTFFQKGMAFLSMKYENLKPQLQTQHAIESINGQPCSALKHHQKIRGRKFVFKLNNHQTWVAYFDYEIELQLTSTKLVSAVQVYNGYVQSAILDPSDTSQSKYDPFASCVLVGGQLNLETGSRYGFDWKTAGACPNGVLHFALDHQVQSIDRSLAEPVDLHLHSATRGKLSAFRTTTPVPRWRFAEADEIDIGFYPRERAPKELIEKYKILEHLQHDIASEWQFKKDGSLYFNGKLAQKYANLCLMASIRDLAGENNRLLEECLSKLEQVFQVFIANSWKYRMVYDDVYGGISSSVAFLTGEKWADFGNSMFNDHHYHYGYWIVASSIMKQLNPDWEHMGELNRVIELLLRDVANPSDQDIYFPKFRHFDWFAGHSYSHGVSPFRDGKDEESTSEEMNLHYGLMLWGIVSNIPHLEQLGQLMLKVNKRAIQTYFFMTNDNKVHPPEFIGNKVCGIFFDNKVHYGTWFSPKRFAIHGIQMMPASPMNAYFRSKQFVTEEWSQVLRTLDIITDREQGLKEPWSSVLYTNLATIDRDYAIQQLSKAALDDGLSRAWALYYAAAQPPAVYNSVANTAYGAKRLRN